MDFLDEEERYYEPSAADEILSEFKSKMGEALLASVKEDILTLKRTNEALVNENKRLKDEKEKVRALERQVKYEKENLMYTVKKERLSELMKDFNVVMFKVYNMGRKQEKCSTCDENRKIHFVSPQGKKLQEQCDCDKSFSFYVPQQYDCCEFRDDRYGKKLLAWYKVHREKDHDYYSYDSSNFAETVYNDQMKFADLSKFDTYFVSMEDCQKYCDWLNGQGGA